jgi:predicted PurR-regulated permease PerM
MSRPKDDLAKTVISILALCGLIIAVFWIVRPFLTSAVWAAFIAVSTWPILLRVQKLLWRKRGLAVAAMTLSLLLVFLLPFLGAVGALVSHGGAIADFTKALPSYQIPPPPGFLDKIPVVGAKAHETWRSLAEAGWPALMEKISPYLVKVAHWFAGRVGSVGVLMAQCLLTLVITAVFYASGEEAVQSVRVFLRRLLGQSGEDLLPLVGGAIRGVAMGVVVTALIQSIFSGIGLAVAGVPFAGPLTAAMVILCIAQLGPGLILIPATIWAFSSLGSGWGSFLLIWSLVAMVMDNFIKPILIKAGAPLPVLLVFAGVLGGLMSLGLIGIFVGPVVLAVAHTLTKAWLEREDAPDAVEEVKAEPAHSHVAGSK